MSDTYQAVYDAVRSRIRNGDVGQAVENAIRAAGVDHHAHMASVSIQAAAAQYERPSVLFRPKIYMDGDKWCALYGESIQDGVAGFGDTPADAAANFDAQWVKK